MRLLWIRTIKEPTVELTALTLLRISFCRVQRAGIAAFLEVVVTSFTESYGASRAAYGGYLNRKDCRGRAVSTPNISAVRATISGADYRFCTAAFCSLRLGRRGFAFRYFALSRRHSSKTSASLGCETKRLDDQLLGRFLSLLHPADLLLDRFSLSICSDWYVFWRNSWLARFGDDPLGKPTRRTFLHSEPLAC